MDLSNQSAIVTGGASGLGHATARRLADAGAAVVVVDLPDREGETVRADAVAALLEGVPIRALLSASACPETSPVWRFRT